MRNVLDDRIIISDKIIKMSHSEIKKQIKEIESEHPVKSKRSSKYIIIGNTKFKFT